MNEYYTDEYICDVLNSLKYCADGASCGRCIMHEKYRNGCIHDLICIAARAWEQQLNRKNGMIDTLLRLLEERETNGEF